MKMPEYYYKAELFDLENIWTLKKIAFCLRKQNNFEQAIKYYLEIEKLQPLNIHILMQLGNAFLHQKDFHKALNYYYKSNLIPKRMQVLTGNSLVSFCVGTN